MHQIHPLTLQSVMKPLTAGSPYEHHQYGSKVTDLKPIS